MEKETAVPFPFCCVSEAPSVSRNSRSDAGERHKNDILAALPDMPESSFVDGEQMGDFGQIPAGEGKNAEKKDNPGCHRTIR